MKGPCFHVTVLNERRDQKSKCQVSTRNCRGVNFFVPFCDLNNLLKRVISKFSTNNFGL